MTTDRSERRLAAILAADVVGYSRLVEADEAATLAEVKRHLTELIEPAIAERHGRLVKTMGDGLLAEFASAVDAVACACAIQQAMQGRNAGLPDDQWILYRVGVNVGDIVVENGDIYGDGVNVAARLEGLAEPGGICVSGTVYDHIHGKLDAVFDELGEQRVKNLDRPIRAFRVRMPGMVGPRAKILTRGRPRSRAPAMAAALAAALIVAGTAVWFFGLRDQARPGQAGTARALSIVVLPFANLSGDAKQDYFADAITDDLITDLSRIRGAFVIARGTAFTYKGKTLDAKTVARQLNVRYVLDGSVQRAGNQVRVNTQLIEGDTGAQVWSAKFDRKIKDLLAVQSAITGRIAAVLRAELLEAESRRPKPANLQAWDYAVQGQVMMHNIRLGPNVLLDAKRLFEQALALDPGQALAWEGLAFIHFAAATREIPGVSAPNSSDLALQSAQKAVTLDPRSSSAHVVLGLAHYWKGQGDRALAACERALALNRNNDDAYLCAARANFTLGRINEANRLVEISGQLNPRFRTWRRQFYLGGQHFAQGRYKDALVYLSKAKAEFPRHQSINLYLAATLAMLGRADDAKAALKTYQSLAGGKRNTIEKLRADRAHIVPDFDRLATGLRRAGMPDR